MSKKKSNEVLSVMKGLAITMIVIFHSGCPSWLFTFFSLFHLSIFYFSMGYFFKVDYLKNPLDFIKRKFHGLYLTFVKWQIAFILLHNFLANVYVYESKYSLYEIARRCFVAFKLVPSELMLMSFWYIISAIMCVILYFIIRYVIYIFKPKREVLLLSLLVVCVFIFGIFLLESGFRTEYYVESSFVLVYILFVGEMWHRFEDKIKVNAFIALCCLALLIGFSCVRGLSFVSHDFWNYWQYLIVTIAGVYLVYYVSKQICKNDMLKNLFVILGNNSLYILALHLTAFKLVSFAKVLIYDDLTMRNMYDFTVILKHNDIFWCSAYIIVGITVPLVIMYFIGIIKRNALQLVNNLFSLHSK